jgi:hypothetical protein
VTAKSTKSPGFEAFPGADSLYFTFVTASLQKSAWMIAAGVLHDLNSKQEEVTFCRSVARLAAVEQR